MKKRLFVALAVVVMLLAALSVSASAKWWEDNPFDDVASDAWYYDAAFTQKANAEDVLTKENITLYANWKEKAVVNFVVPEGATPVEPINVWTYDAIEIDAPSLSKE